jgi:hypothetical protein
VRRLAVVALMAGLALPARADTMDGPFYDEHAKSYFALVGIAPGDIAWGKARAQAEKLVFKNVHGRLAIVRDQQTHDFIEKTFRGIHHQAFVGLRFWCQLSKLQWVDGTSPPDNTFAPWNQPWYRSQYDSCAALHPSATTYMGVHYETPEESSTGTLVLRAAGPAKKFSFYLVEFPTGGP